MELEEALAQADVYAEETEVCMIDNDLRTITIPSGLQTVGVESDEDVRRLNFQMPKQYHEIDLSEFNIRINFMNANNSGDVYAVTDKAVSGDNITFSWLVGRNALAYRGSIRFIVCLKRADAEGVVQQEFNTTVATLSVLEGLETTEAVVAENPDIIEQILARLDDLEAGGGGTVDPEQIKQAVNGYLEENPVSGMTEEQEQQLNKNTEDISSLSEELDDLQESTNNIFDEKYVRDYYINPTNGIVGVNSENWGYSENFIPLSSEISSVTFSSPNVKETINIIIICYDSNKQYLSSFGVRSIDSINNYFTVSFKQNSNRKYIRFNIQNVNDIVESNCNLMVEYGTVPTDYYPNKRIKNSTKIEVLEDKIDEIFKEFVIFGETYLEYGKKNDISVIPRKTAYSSQVFYISNGNLLYNVTYYNNNQGNFDGTNVSSNTARIRTNSFIIPSGCRDLVLSGVDLSKVELISVRAFDYQKKVVSSGVIRRQEDLSYAIKIGYDTSYIHLLFGSTDGSIIDPSVMSGMNLMLNVGSISKSYILPQRTSLNFSNEMFNTKIKLEGRYTPYDNNLMFTHGSGITFDYFVNNKVQGIVDSIVKKYGEYTRSKFRKKYSIPDSYFFKYYEPKITNIFSIDTTTDEYMNLVDALMNSSNGYITRTSSGIKDASDTWTLFTYWISDPYSASDKPTIELVCNQHGYEKNGAFAAYWLMDILANHWMDNDMLRILHQNFKFVITPLANPWGFNQYNSNTAYTQTGYANSEGVNINRDFEDFNSAEARYIRDITQPNTMLSIDVHANGSTRDMNEYTEINWLSFNEEGDVSILEQSKEYLNVISAHITKELGIPYQKVGRYSFNTGIPTITKFWTELNKTCLCFETPCRLPNEEKKEFSLDCQKYAVEMLVNYIGMYIASAKHAQSNLIN